MDAFIYCSVGPPALDPRLRARHAVPPYMGKYTVTQEQYQQVMGVNPSYFKGKESNLPV